MGEMDGLEPQGCPGQIDVRGPGAQGSPDFPVLSNDETLRGC